jgi:hypothetical protein
MPNCLSSQLTAGITPKHKSAWLWSEPLKRNKIIVDYRIFANAFYEKYLIFNYQNDNTLKTHSHNDIIHSSQVHYVHLMHLENHNYTVSIYTI